MVMLGASSARKAALSVVNLQWVEASRGCNRGFHAFVKQFTRSHAIYASMAMTGFSFPAVFRPLAVIGLFALASCSPPQPLNFSVQNVQPSRTQIDADLRDVTATAGAPDERTGDLPPVVAQLTGPWKEAAKEALSRAAIFDDDAKRHVNLEIKILKFDVPVFGVTFPTATDARYTVIDRSTGEVLFSQIISAQGSTPIGFAFAGAIRARESINRSVQNNIASFLAVLESSPAAVSRNRQPAS